MTEEQEKILREFAEKIIRPQQRLPADFEKVYWDNLDDLYA